MKVILKNSTIQFQETPQPGSLVTITPDFVNSDYQGAYRIKSDGTISASASPSSNSRVSAPISVAGYDKVIITNPVNNAYVAQCAFFTSASSASGSNAVVVSESSVPSVEVNIPSGAQYVRFGNNMDSNGNVVDTRTIQMRVAVEE